MMYIILKAQNGGYKGHTKINTKYKIKEIALTITKAMTRQVEVQQNDFNRPNRGTYKNLSSKRPVLGLRSNHEIILDHYLFDHPDDQVNAFNCLFLQVLDDHAPIKRIRINSRPNPFITPEIKGQMNMRDMWHKKALKTNDKLHSNAYRFFPQEVKREIKLAEKEHVRSEILKSNGNSNSICKILNRCIPKKNAPLAAVDNPLLLADKFNEF